MASGSYTRNTTEQLLLEEGVSARIPARATRKLPVAQESLQAGYNGKPETKPVSASGRPSPNPAPPRAVKKNPLPPRPQTIAITPPPSGMLVRPLDRVTRNYWLKAGVICLICAIGFLTLPLSVGIFQRPVSSYISNYGSVYDQARIWQQEHSMDQQAKTIEGNDLPRGLSADKPYVRYAWDAAQKAKIDPAIFVRQINQESGFNPKAVSSAGAIGIAQFMPSTAAGLSNPLGPGMLDPLNPEQALTASALYMAAKLQAFGGDYAKALAAYNAGSGGVQRAIAEATRVEGNPDAWRNYLPNETQRYIQIILG